MVFTTEACKDEVAEKVGLQCAIEQQIQILEEQQDLQEQERKQLELSFMQTRNMLAECKSKLRNTLAEKNEQQYLTSADHDNVENLHDETRMLMETAKTIISSTHTKIDDLRSVNKANNDGVRKACLKVISCCGEAVDKLTEFKLNFNAKKRSLDDKTRSLEYYCAVGSTLTETEVLNEAGKFVGASCSQLEKACDKDILARKRFLQGIRENLQEANYILGSLDIEVELHKDKILSVTKELNEQRDAFDKTFVKIKEVKVKMQQIEQLVDETRECLHEMVHNQETAKQYNMACSTHVDDVMDIANNNIKKIMDNWGLGRNQVSRLVLQTAKIIDENQRPVVACKKVLEEILLCKEFFKKVDSNQSLEDSAKNLNKNAMAFTTDIKNLFAAMTPDVTEITNQVSMAAEHIEEQKDIVELKAQEIKDTVVDLVENQLVSVPEIGTLVRELNMTGFYKT